MSSFYGKRGVNISKYGIVTCQNSIKASTFSFPTIISIRIAKQKLPVPEPNTDSDDYYGQPYFTQNSLLTRTSREMESAMNAALDKSLCTDFVDFGKHQDRFGRFSWFKNEKNYLEIHFKVFKKDIAKEFKLYQCVSLGQYDFKQFLRLRNQLIVAADNCTKEENLPYINVVGLSRDN